MKIVAHRGCSVLAFENSRNAFKFSTQYSDAVEFDIQLTKDHVLVVAHDDCLKELCDQNVKISETKYDDLPKYTSGDDILTFEEVRKICADLFMHIEIKNSKAWPFLKHIIPKNSLVSSFDVDVIKKASTISTSLFLVEGGVERNWKSKSGANFLGLHRSFLYHAFFSFDPKEIYLYTVNNPLEVFLSQKREFAGIYCDQPEKYQQSKR